MICPKCGFEQPDSPECMRCGIIVSRYKGPVLGGAAVPPSPPPAPAPPPPMAASAVGTVFGDPVPAMAGSGTVYDGPPPGAVSGGTVYQGPAAGAPGAQRRPGMAPVLMVTQKLRFGEILGESFLIYLKNFIPFSILTAFAFSPIYLFGDYLLRRVVAEGSASKMGMALLVILATLLVCVPLSTSMITYGVFQEMRGRSASLGSCLSVGLSSLLPVFSVAFLQALFVFVGWFCTSFVVGFLIGFARASGGSSGAGCSVLLTPLIAFAFILPVMIWLRFFVAVPAAVEERPGVMEAMRRSVFLTEGQRGRIFWIVFVLAILTGGVQLGAGRVPVAGPVLQPVVGLLASSLFATTCAVIYYRLRSFHESIDVDQIASVFD